MNFDDQSLDTACSLGAIAECNGTRDTCESAIRLVAFEPSSWTDTPAEYLSLSYIWGDQVCTHQSDDLALKGVGSAFKHINPSIDCNSGSPLWPISSSSNDKTQYLNTTSAAPSVQDNLLYWPVDNASQYDLTFHASELQDCSADTTPACDMLDILPMYSSRSSTASPPPTEASSIWLDRGLYQCGECPKRFKRNCELK